MRFLFHPEKYILEKGGFIYFLLENEILVDTFALMLNKLGELKLIKMEILESAKGIEYGNELMKYVINKAKTMNFENLYSNTSLLLAIHLYKKYGFLEIPV